LIHDDTLMKLDVESCHPTCPVRRQQAID